MSHFRNFARKAIERAKNEIESNDSFRLRYAALELREVLEALTYDRAAAFKKEMPPEEYSKWQPRKLMAALVNIDPTLVMSSIIRVGREETFGVPPPPEQMKVLGTEHVVTVKDLKTHYDALGSFLHFPSLNTIESNRTPDHTDLRKRCDAVIELAEKVLSSNIYNSTLGSFLHWTCTNSDCGEKLHKRVPHNVSHFSASCFTCNAEYRAVKDQDGSWQAEACTTAVPCSTENCEGKIKLWPHELKPGTRWKCNACGAANVLGLCVEPFPTKTA